MNRVRLALGVLAVAIAVPVVALVLRALESAEVERRLRHQAVAHRTFDEMERVLSGWLEREEARPFSDYEFYAGAASTSTGVRRSPLSLPPAEAFVVGAFQVDPDGTLHTPLEPRDVRTAEARGDWPPPEVVRRRIERVRELAAVLPEHGRRLRLPSGGETPGSGRPSQPRGLGVEMESDAAPTRSFDEGPSLALRPAAPAARLQEARDAAADGDPAVEQWRRTGAPKREAGAKETKQAAERAGTPVVIVEDAVAHAVADAPPPEEAWSAFQALENLNFASSQRAELRQKAQREEQVQVARKVEPELTELQKRAVGRSESGRTEPGRAEADRDLRSGSAPGLSAVDAVAEMELARPPAAPTGAALGTAIAEGDRARGAPATASTERAEGGDTVRISLDPMTGVALPTFPPMLALYRTAIVDARGHRQGLILDLEALGEMLEADVVRAGGLAPFVDVRFSPAGAPVPAPAAAGRGFVFVHRFAEPFDALSVRLDLLPLDDDAERRTLLVLAGLVVVLTLAGLVVVDRMTRVVIDFAERRSNFVAAVSHELKTPLTSIRMYAEMLRDGLVPTEERRAEYLATISDESERLGRLIHNVLEFSRLEKGGEELALVAGDVAPTVEDVARRLRPFAERAGFTLRVEVEPDLPPVLFEKDALVQVVFNLVDNAIKYAQAATRREIVVAVARCDEGVEVTVRDFGPGVATSALRRVFEPFHRGESELTRRTKGTGIGLALVAELASAMRAHVVGESPDDGGFRVRLTLMRG